MNGKLQWAFKKSHIWLYFWTNVAGAMQLEDLQHKAVRAAHLRSKQIREILCWMSTSIGSMVLDECSWVLDMNQVIAMIDVVNKRVLKQMKQCIPKRKLFSNRPRMLGFWVKNITSFKPKPRMSLLPTCNKFSIKFLFLEIGLKIMSQKI